ncbi:YolD-like family protein [Peribacillus acanthi]|uniref:YolD-like family protein n=1 Tax=Peribacillus acanthi TaxID=2171554 RepID=UPI000D3E7FD9|nr:YolD-like family protein [Peribacillus acanthi]
MVIRDRGKIKWGSSFFLPEHTKMLRDLKSDYYKIKKPILDDYQIEEIESKICLAMEFNHSIKITTWEGGFEWSYNGNLHRLDPLTKKLYLELLQEDPYIMKVDFSDIIAAEVLDMAHLISGDI